MSRLRGLFVLSMMMPADRSEEEILRLTTTSVPSLGPCQTLAGYLLRDGRLTRYVVGCPDPDPMLDAQVEALGGMDGAIVVENHDWAWAYPLRGLGGLRGYLVVSAAMPPSEDEHLLLRLLGQQTGAALASATAYLEQLRQAQELRTLTEELATTNEQLAATVSQLARQTEIHEVLNKVSVTGDGEQGIARAVHRLTGLPVAVEDVFGNLHAWAGPDRPQPYPVPHPRTRAEVIRHAQHAGRPFHDKDRLIALAQPRDEVLGVLALVDPGHVAGTHEVFALEHAATVLAMELAHLRGLAEVELRLRRELVEDLLEGTDQESAVARARAIGHDLSQPHHVIVVQDDHDETVARAAERAVAGLELECLMAKRTDQVVMVARPLAVIGKRPPWQELYRSITANSRSDSVFMGVGGRADVAAELPRSWHEARRALSIRRNSRGGAGVTAFEELGIYRILSSGNGDVEMGRFIREWLGTLLDYDEEHNSELVRTLSLYLECGGNYDATAEALIIHRSTLRYRLQRIHHVSGLDLSDVDHRLNLHVATRALAVRDGTF
jgi:sugar diacid utilization regulator